MIINEGISNIIYHFTNLFSLKSILEMNKFRASTNIGSDADLNTSKGKFYFFSTTRSKSKQYSNGNVKIVLDGRKLSSKYKGFPIDYWKYSKNPNDWDNRQSYINNLKNGGEDEDRIISDKPYIDDAKKYIKEIHISLGKYELERTTEHDIKNILFLSNNIPIFFYLDKKDYLMEIKNKAVDPLSLKLNKGGDDSGKKYSDSKNLSRIIALLSYKDNVMKNKILDLISNDDDRENLSNDIDETIKKNKYDYYKSFKYENDYTKLDFLNLIKSDIHNARSSNNNKSVKIIEILTDYMRKYKLKNLNEFLHFKLKGSYKYINDYRKDYYNEIITSLDNSIIYNIDRHNEYQYEIYYDRYSNIFNEFPQLKNFILNIGNKVKKYLQTVIYNRDTEFRFINVEIKRDKIFDYIGYDNIDYNKIINVDNEYIPLSEELIDDMKRIIDVIIRDVDYDSYSLYEKYIEIFKNQDINENKLIKIIKEELNILYKTRII